MHYILVLSLSFKIILSGDVCEHGLGYRGQKCLPVEVSPDSCDLDSRVVDVCPFVLLLNGPLHLLVLVKT